MDRTLVLIGRAHQGDKAARDLLFEENKLLAEFLFPVLFYLFLKGRE